MDIRPLSLQERSALESGLNMAERFVDGNRPFSVSQIQELYAVIMRDHPDYDEGKIALGLAFGDLIVAQAHYEWVRVIDEYGEETVLSPSGTKIICSPISIIQRRIERNETVDIGELRDGIIDAVQKQIDSGDYDIR